MIDKKKSEKLPFGAKDLAFWRNEIKLARQMREDVADLYGWDDNLKRYVPKAARKTADGTTVHDQVNIGADFRDVERKKAALFFDTPEVGLTVKQDRAITPKDEQEAALLQGLGRELKLSTLVMWQQELLNALLGPQHANIKPTVLQAIFDCLCPAGVGPVSVGYQVTMQKVPQQVPVMDELGQPVMKPVPAIAQAAAALGLAPAPTPEPLMQEIEVEVPINERWFVSRFSPKALLIPANFKDTQFSRAPWLGKDWRKPTSQVVREHGLKKDWTAGNADETIKTTFDGPEQLQGKDEESAGDPYVTGVEIYYRKQLRSNEEEHPDALIKLVLADGHDEPLEHKPCPYQDFTDLGEMTPNSLKGFMDRPLVLRQLSDAAWVPSDCSVTGALTKELEKYRERGIEQRNHNLNVIGFDSDVIDPTALDKIKRGPGGAWVPLKAGALAQGKDQIMVQVAQAVRGREEFMFQEIIEKDREQILGIGANQSGIQTKGRRTATENSIVQRNSEARFEQERQAVKEWFLDVVSAFDTLVLRYADARIAVQILGENRGQLWAQFKDHLVGGYTYDLSIDSGRYLDVEADRRQWLQLYNQIRQDPFVNPRPILQKVSSVWGIDPSELITEPQPPQKELKASVSFKGEDFNPLNPAFAIVVALARQGGWQIDEVAVQEAQKQAMAQGQGLLPASGVGPDPNAPKQAQHPGAAPTAPTINQHQFDESGDRSGPKTGVM